MALLAVLAFLPALENGFVAWDDDRNFLENPRYRGLGLTQLRWMWTTFHMGHYIPLSWMTLGLDYTVWGMNPFGYHLTSVLLHAGAAVALYFVALRLFRSMAGPWRADPRGPALAAAGAALLFALHPLRVESVAWVTERRDVLSGLFFFLSLLGYLRAVDRVPPDRRRLGAALALFVCALLSKASAVVLPAVLLVLDVYPLRRLGGDRGWWGPVARTVYLEKLVFLVPAAAAAALAPVALGDLPQLGVAGKLAVSAWSWVFYLWKSVVPAGLSPLYPMPDEVHPFAGRFVLAYAAVIGIAVVVWRARRRMPGLAVAWLTYGVVLLPLLGVFQNGPQIAADRYTYLAGAVLGLLGAAGLAFLARPLALGAGAAIVVALGGLTWKQIGIWHDSERLWTRVIDQGAESELAYTNLGNELVRQGRVEEAIERFRQALAIKPGFAEAHAGWGTALARAGRPAEAIERYRLAVESWPGYARAHGNWGAALAQLGRLDEAIEHYRRALELDPSLADAAVNWGNALVRTGRFDEAIDRYRRALEFHPGLASAHANWGTALALQGKMPEAIEQYRRALALDPGDADTRELLARALRLESRK